MAVSPGNPDEPLQELKHDAVPGYPRAFAIAFATMGLYLALILVTSPGPAKHGHGYEKDHHPPKEDASSAHPEKKSPDAH